MKRKIALGCLLVVGCVLSIIGLMHKNERGLRATSAYELYNSTINMKKSLEEIKTHLVKSYSYKNGNKFIGTATVSMPYDSFGVIGENIRQGDMNDVWNSKNPKKKWKELVALLQIQ